MQYVEDIISEALAYFPLTKQYMHSTMKEVYRVISKNRAIEDMETPKQIIGLLETYKEDIIDRIMHVASLFARKNVEKLYQQGLDELKKKQENSCIATTTKNSRAGIEKALNPNGTLTNEKPESE